jgi:hypothetical protein
MNITYIKGDVTSPQAKGLKLIVYICDDRGGWGKGSWSLHRLRRREYPGRAHILLSAYADDYLCLLSHRSSGDNASVSH